MIGNNFLNNYKSRFSFYISNYLINPWLLASIIIGIIIRLSFLFEPFRSDEVSTFFAFIESSNPLRAFLFHPNNHFLHNILSKIIYVLFGFSFSSLRLVSFVSGILSIPICFFISKKIDQDGRFAAITMATYPMLIHYSVNARGYSLLVLFFLLSLESTIEFLKSFSKKEGLYLAIFIALGAFTIPTMLFAASGLFLYILINIFFTFKENNKRLNVIKKVFQVILITFFVTLIFYLPIIFLPGNFSNFINDETLKPLTAPEIFLNLIPHVSQAFGFLTNYINLNILISYVLLIILGYLNYIAKKNQVGFLLLPSLLVGALIIIFLKFSIPWFRIWIYFIPIFLIIGDNGFTFLINFLSKNWKKFITLILFTCLLISIKPFHSPQPFGVFERGFPDSPLALEIIESFRKKENIKLARIYSIMSVQMPMQFDLYQKDYPMLICNTKIRKKSFLEAIKLDFQKITGKRPKTHISNENKFKGGVKAFYIYDKRFPELKYDDESIKKGITIFENNSFQIINFIAEDDFKCKL